MLNILQLQKFPGATDYTALRHPTIKCTQLLAEQILICFNALKRLRTKVCFIFIHFLTTPQRNTLDEGPLLFLRTPPHSPPTATLRNQVQSSGWCRNDCIWGLKWLIAYLHAKVKVEATRVKTKQFRTQKNLSSGKLLPS